MTDESRTIIAILLLLLPIPPLAMMVMIVEHVWSKNLALRERTGVAVRDLVVALIIALLSANYLFALDLNTTLVTVLSLCALAAVSVPSLIWLTIYFRSGFR